MPRNIQVICLVSLVLSDLLALLILYYTICSLMVASYASSQILLEGSRTHITSRRLRL